MKSLLLFAALLLMQFALTASAARRAYVFDASCLTFDERAAAIALQGLVNRAGPRLFLLEDRANDARWQAIYAERYGFAFEPIPDLHHLFETFRAELKGLAVYPPSPDGARWVALTESGLQALLPVSEAMFHQLTPGLRAGYEWTGEDFASLEGWRRIETAKLEHTSGGARLTATAQSEWTFVSLPSITWDLDKYPFLEVKVASCRGRWGVKLTYDRNHDGKIGGNDDDLVLPTENEPGTFRYNIRRLTGKSGKFTFALLQLHMLTQGGEVIFSLVRPCDAAGVGPSPRPLPTLEEALQLPVRCDLRGRFKDSLEAYEYELQHLLPRADKHLAYSADADHDGMPTGCGPFDGFDYVLMKKGVCFNLTPAERQLPSYGGRKVGGSPEEARLFNEFCARLTPPAEIIGYGEPEDVYCSTLSRHGHFSIHFGANWSFHCHVKAHKPFHQRPSAKQVKLQQKIYLAFMQSEGDTLKFPLTFGYGGWFDPKRGQVPINWGINPLMARQFPAVLEYYYDEATPNDYFFAGCSGAGYVYPDDMPDIAPFAHFTAKVASKADTPIIDLWRCKRADVLAKYAEIARPAAFTEGAAHPGVTFLPGGVPLINEPFFYWQGQVAGPQWRKAFDDPAQRKAALKELANSLKAMATPLPKPCFLLLYGDLHSFYDVATTYCELMDLLPDDFEAVRLDTLVKLVNQAYRDRLLLAENEGFAQRLVAVVPGKPLRLALPLQSTFDKAVRVKLSAEGARVAPPLERKFEPFEEKRWPLELETAAPPHIKLQAEAAGRTFAFNFTTAVFEPEADLDLSAYREVACYPAAALAHGTGEEGKAPGSWLARPGNAKPAHMLYGPYVSLPEGRYLLLVKLQAKAEGPIAVCTLDVNASGLSPDSQIAKLQLTGADFAGRRTYTAVVPFEWHYPSAKAEFRCWWDGKVAVEVEALALFKQDEAPHQTKGM